MIQRLSSSKKVKIVNLIEPYPDKEALQLAKNFNLDISNDFEQAVKSIDFDVSKENIYDSPWFIK